ncbi:hypothetical protein Apa02nite_001920 [Actinoplanes palleronii]|uniref:Uncharacterized protein n=1 Tax=Actinoplanes palleronii TaxID=113570 RepID=A0ABQ4B0C7_9ACTN|nr:hypothetical protein Apa02nite_001920 [Actinoplanes palleronii]
MQDDEEGKVRHRGRSQVHRQGAGDLQYGGDQRGRRADHQDDADQIQSCPAEPDRVDRPHEPGREQHPDPGGRRAGRRQHGGRRDAEHDRGQRDQPPAANPFAAGDGQDDRHEQRHRPGQQQPDQGRRGQAPAERGEQEVRQPGEAERDHHPGTFPADRAQRTGQPRREQEHRGDEPQERGVDRRQAGGADPADGERERCPQDHGRGECGHASMTVHERFPPLVVGGKARNNRLARDC